MELDVRLSRSGDQPWGFRLIGGTDFNMPLTVVKVIPNSPADAAGLRNGDTVAHIDGADSTSMSHEDSKKVLATAGTDLRLGIIRGLYDMVLDDYDPVFEPIDQDDFDQPSQPTEVPLSDLDLDLTFTLPEFAQAAPEGLFKPLPDLVNGQKPDSRSLTASPFVVPTKPYRPFSTEPLSEIPDLEQPIILNPNFHDEFAILKDVEEFLPKTKFKLPISKQYDPDGTKQKMKLEGMKTKDVSTKECVTATEAKILKEETKVKKEIDMKDQIMTKQEVTFMEQIIKDIDLETIEKTAISIVDESIERAMTVAEEIKREIDVELSESSESESSQLKCSKKISKIPKSTTETTESARIEIENKSKADKILEEVTELVDLTDRNTQEIEKQKEYTTEKKISQVDECESIMDKKQSMRNISQTEKIISNEQEIEICHRQEDVKESQSLDVKQFQNKLSKAEEITVEEHYETVDKTKSQSRKDINSETKYSTSKLLSEQRAYTIGLQTIPNIRGTVHSSYHYDLLLKTFFIHLTDVMVALSRFILAEPVLSKPPEQQEMDTVSKTKETVYVEKQDKIQKDDTASKAKVQHEETTVVSHKLVPAAKKERVVGKILQKAQEIKQHDKQESVRFTEMKENVHEHTYEHDYKRDDVKNSAVENVKTRELSGIKMAQLTQKKPEELMLNMENVLTEFESKSSNEDIEIVRERRSKSRSAAATPVEMMQHEMSEHMTSSAMSSVMTESKTSRMSESGYETTDYETVEDAKSYIAIVQSHVYTNKDAIFEAARRQSIEESVIKESIESVKTNKVSDKSLKTSEKAVQAVVDTSAKMVSTVMEDKVERTEKKEEKVKEVQKVQEVSKREDIKSAEKVQDVVIQEIIEPVVTDLKSTFTQDYIVTEDETETSKSEYISEHKEKLTIIEETAAMNEESYSFKFSEETEKVSSFKDESISLDTEKVSLKQETVSASSVQEVKEPVKEEVAVKEQLKEEIISVKKEVQKPMKSILVRKTFVPPELPVKQEAPKKSILVRKTFVLPKQQTQSAALKISKEHITEKEKMIVEIEQRKDISIKKVEINEFESNCSQFDQESTFVAKSVNQESTFVAKSVDQESTFVAKSVDQESTLISKSINQETVSVTKSVDNRAGLKLALNTDYDKKKTEQQVYEEGDLTKTPTPSTVPPTPLTDEYVFKLTTKLPKREGLPDIPRDCTPSDDEDEDPHIVKKGLVPHVEANIEEPKIFDPPLPTPPTTPQSPTSKALGLKGGAPFNSMPPMARKKPMYFKPGLRGGAPMFPMFSISSKTPVYFKPGLRGGVDRDSSQEEIKEIELKSSLLASAIDETIKSIEEYKEEVGIKQPINKSLTEVKTEDAVQNGVMYNGYAKVVETRVYDDTVSEKSEHESKHEVKTEIVKENNVNKEQSQYLTNGVSDKSVETTIESRLESTAQMNGFSDNSAMDIAVPKEKSPTEEKNITVSAQTEIQPVETPKFEVKQFVIKEEKRDPMDVYRRVPFDSEELNQRERRTIKIPFLAPSQERDVYKTPAGEIIGTHQGIVDGLEDSIVDTETAKELGKPGITEEKIAELISGEAEMLREAHVMGLSRVLKSHMHRDGDDCSVDFNKIKPIVESLKDSEVLKALNEELLRDAGERKKKEATKEAWTTFLQKPKRPVPRSKFGYYKDMEPEEEKVPIYKPKIVKQPKPKIAPDYKPKSFNTGLLPWEERALHEPTPPPVEPEDPILIPEEPPEIFEAVDPLPESEVPDLEDSGIPLPQPPTPKEATPPLEETTEDQQEELDLEAVIEETEKIVEEKIVEEMDSGNIAEQIMSSVQNMVDPNAPLEQQLAQMRAQLAALAQLPGVIQQSLELVTRQLAMMGQRESQKTPAIQELAEADMTPAAVEETEVSEDGITTIEEMPSEPEPQPESVETPAPVELPAPTLTAEEVEKMRREEELMIEEQRKMEKQKKELMEQARYEQESRQIKQRPTPRVGNPMPDPRVGSPAPRKPQPVFGPAAPTERPVVLPGGRKWKTPKDAYNDAFIKETLQAQAELIAGKAMGVNFMKYEKPPVSLDHLKDSDVYKMVHNMDVKPQARRVEMLTPVIAECDYREKCRSMTPCSERCATVQP
ncbi:hypothetical protein O0L34_g10719 [Tuta absoluta]|nr:hypothetical protein O0L34_g10719 [Tuta absoluta]